MSADDRGQLAEQWADIIAASLPAFAELPDCEVARKTIKDYVVMILRDPGKVNGFSSRDATITDIHTLERERDTLRFLLERKEAGEAEFVALRNHQMQAAYKREEEQRQRADAAERAVEKYKKETATAWTRIADLEAHVAKAARVAAQALGTIEWFYRNKNSISPDSLVGDELREIAALAAPASPAKATKIECKHGCGQPLDRHYVERQFKDGRETYSEVKCPATATKVDNDGYFTCPTCKHVGSHGDECQWLAEHYPSGVNLDTHTCPQCCSEPCRCLEEVP